jgi:hypothetical protein
VGKNQQKIDELKVQMRRVDIDEKELKKLHSSLLELLNQRSQPTVTRIYKQGAKEYEVGRRLRTGNFTRRAASRIWYHQRKLIK